ncbi:hypothetical protein L484_007358 [Morus notabilis]|uniref:COBRA-like protein 1 n=1 Tax=Morus notabilis TaxID=981085 RepID=W9RBW2_9ROSA|nr:hypothetical protein L484_007358 [Morus notabilis]
MFHASYEELFKFSHTLLSAMEIWQLLGSLRDLAAVLGRLTLLASLHRSFLAATCADCAIFYSCHLVVLPWVCGLADTIFLLTSRGLLFSVFLLFSMEEGKKYPFIQEFIGPLLFDYYEINLYSLEEFISSDCSGIREEELDWNQFWVLSESEVKTRRNRIFMSGRRRKKSQTRRLKTTSSRICRDCSVESQVKELLRPGIPKQLAFSNLLLQTSFLIQDMLMARAHQNYKSGNYKQALEHSSALYERNPRRTVAYDAFDPYGSINIKWDIVSWTPDGYVAVVTIQNSQIYRPIMSPGWTIGWTWAKKEVIWSMVGAQATDQGDCSKFKGNIPHCCMRNPTIVDLLPGVPNNQRFFDCCKGGVLAPSEQDPSPAVSAFQLSVGLSGTSNKTVKPPKNFYLLGPGPGYTCGAATIAPPTVSLSADGRRRTRTMNDAGMFYGIKYFNDLLMEAGPNGHVQTELLLKKDKTTFTLDQGWAFPLKIYFNGDECMMPLPDSYPSLPNSAYRNSISSFTLATLLLMVLLA